MARGTVHLIAGCFAHCSYTLYGTLPAGEPMPKTDPSSSCSVPPRAPTTRSVPLIVPVKLSRMPRRACSTPSNSVMLRATAMTVRTEVTGRLRSDRHARLRSILIGCRSCGVRACGAIERGQ